LAEDRSWIFLGLRWSDWQGWAQPIGKRDQIIGPYNHFTEAS
jgi:hypothetical protein